MTSPQFYDEARGDAPVPEPAQTDMQTKTEKVPIDTPLTSTDMEHDTPRPDAAEHGITYTLSVEQVMQRLDVEGVSKARRTVQKYMKRGEIDARLVPVKNGQFRWFANELDLARFIEELKRKEALALYSKPVLPGIETVHTVKEPIPQTDPPREVELSASDDLVVQLNARLDDAKSEIEFLRSSVKDANAHVKLWSDRASELKDLLQRQTDNNAPVLAAFAASLHAQSGTAPAPDRAPAPIEARAAAPPHQD